MDPSKPLICIVGPTAAGKTRLAIALAQRFGGEIINADSRQVYRGMDIGTAKPTPEERAQAPHHLLDLLDPNQDFGLGSFLASAHEALSEIVQRGKLPIVAGGAGQYVWALAEGSDVPHVPPDREFREALEREAVSVGGEALHRRLQAVDPKRAEALDPRNVRRVIRALEIFHATGQKPSGFAPSQDQHPRAGDMPLVIGITLDRRDLYRRIDARVDRMMADGFLDEVGRLVAVGYAPGMGAMASPGYRELGLHLAGELGLDEAVERTKFQTHRLARRQYTWFKPSDPRIRWVDGASPDCLPQASAIVEQYLDSGTSVIQ